MINVPGIPNGIMIKPSTIAPMSSKTAMSAELRCRLGQHSRRARDARAAHRVQAVSRRVYPLQRTNCAAAECQSLPPGARERDVVGENPRNQSNDAKRLV